MNLYMPVAIPVEKKTWLCIAPQEEKQLFSMVHQREASKKHFHSDSFHCHVQYLSVKPKVNVKMTGNTDCLSSVALLLYILLI